MTKLRLKLKVREPHNPEYLLQRTVKLDMSKDAWDDADYDKKLQLANDAVKNDDYLNAEDVQYKLYRVKAL
jgi:hypothetical protein